MILFHPRRFVRRMIPWCEGFIFRLKCRIKHVHCEIGENTRIRHCRVESKKDGVLIIGSNCTLQGAKFCFYGCEGRIELKDRVYINAYPWARASFFVSGHSAIRVGSDCLFSNTVDVATTDWHRIYDQEGNVLNPDKDVQIGNHVWCGRKVTIGKGVSLPDNAIIGACSMVTKSFVENDGIVIVGNPADVKKRGVRWHL